MRNARALTLRQTKKIMPLPPDGLILWKIKFPPEITFNSEHKSALRSKRVLHPSYVKRMQQANVLRFLLEDAPSDK